MAVDSAELLPRAARAGMCAGLEAAGLIGALDRVAGFFAGALNASATAMERGALEATRHETPPREKPQLGEFVCGHHDADMRRAAELGRAS